MWIFHSCKTQQRFHKTNCGTRLFLLMLLWGGVWPCWGQAPAPGGVLQLPSFRTFSVTGGVLVPDGGGVSLGGVSRWEERSRRGPGGLAWGRAASSSNVVVSATIIDLQAIDRQILGEHGMNPRRPAGVRPSLLSVEDCKALVRYARKRSDQGDLNAARIAYEDAITALRRHQTAEALALAAYAQIESDKRVAKGKR